MQHKKLRRLPGYFAAILLVACSQSASPKTPPELSPTPQAAQVPPATPEPTARVEGAALVATRTPEPTATPAPSATPLVESIPAAHQTVEAFLVRGDPTSVAFLAALADGMLKSAPTVAAWQTQEAGKPAQPTQEVSCGQRAKEVIATAVLPADPARFQPITFETKCGRVVIAQMRIAGPKDRKDRFTDPLDTRVLQIFIEYTNLSSKEQYSGLSFECESQRGKIDQCNGAGSEYQYEGETYDSGNYAPGGSASGWRSVLAVYRNPKPAVDRKAGYIQNVLGDGSGQFPPQKIRMTAASVGTVELTFEGEQ
jgi:hypothetical protein